MYIILQFPARAKQLKFHKFHGLDAIWMHSVYVWMVYWDQREAKPSFGAYLRRVLMSGLILFFLLHSYSFR